MATLSGLYKACPLNILKDEIRVLHLFPKNVSKASGEKDQVLVSEPPIRDGPVGVTREEINTNISGIILARRYSGQIRA